MSDADLTPESEPELNGMELAVKEVLEEVGSKAIGSSEDAMHLYFGLFQAIDNLGAGPVQVQLYEEFDWYRAIWDGEIVLLEGAADSEEAKNVWVDRMADFDKRAGDLLSKWLRDKGLAQVTLWVYMLCHRQFVSMTFQQTGLDEGVDSAAA